MTSTGRSLWFLVVGVAGGAGGALLLRPSPARGPALREPVATAAPVPVVRCTASLSDEQLQSLRDEIARVRPAGPTEATAAEPPREASAQSQTASLAATNVVTAAIDRGTWTDGDKAAFAHELPQLSQGQLQEVMGRLTVAINEGRLRPQTSGPIIGF